MAGSGDEAEPPFEPPFEPFDLALDQSITVGAFELQLGEVHVVPATDKWAPHAQVLIDFRAHNLSASVATPLGGLRGDGLVLEAMEFYFFGEVRADPVPGVEPQAIS